jgi:hypothetical protein
MNKRIKLLADQAEDYATAEYEKWIPTPDFSGIPHIRKIFNEKFAELIVRETLDQVAEFSRLTKAYQEQGIDPEIDVAKEVLKNFGVKE